MVKPKKKKQKKTKGSTSMNNSSSLPSAATAAPTGRVTRSTVAAAAAAGAASTTGTTLPLCIPYEAPLDIASEPPPPTTSTATTSTTGTASTSASSSSNSSLKADDEEEDVETCAICWEDLNMAGGGMIQQIQKCQHKFHQACLSKSIAHDTKCPVCRCAITDEPIGHGPSGTMKITALNHKVCPGYHGSPKSIQIEYTLPSGIQYMYHEHPNIPYAGANRVAYLPNNVEGRQLLSRLQYAFMHGLCFRIGTSLTNGTPNCVTWASIHHKTSLEGGVHGFPDPNYIDNCNTALDVVHVPPAGHCGIYDVTNSSSNSKITETTLSYTAPITLSSSIALQTSIQPYTATAAAVGSYKNNKSTTTTTTTSLVSSQQLSVLAPPPLPLAMAAAPMFVSSATSIAPHDQGKCPSGTMTISHLDTVICPGFAHDTTTLQIVYAVPSGHQMKYHPNPGMLYTGTTRTTYLPNTPEGRQLLARMVYAWRRGHVFNIGTSLTTGQTNVVVWSTSISHKTSLLSGGRQRYGPFSFPDPQYIAFCNTQLDALSIPTSLPPVF